MKNNSLELKKKANKQTNKMQLSQDKTRDLVHNLFKKKQARMMMSANISVSDNFLTLS